MRRGVDVGLEQFPTWCKVLEIVHVGNAQVGRVGADGQHIQTKTR